MQNKRTITILILGALAAALVFGGIAYRSVFAATPTATTTTNTNVQADIGMGRGPLGGFTKEDLANALGITVDELTTAYQTAYTNMLKEAVSQGLITQAQADELQTNGRVFPFGNRWGNWLSQNGIDFNTYLADALGISVDELSAAYKTAFDTRVDQAVTDGKITEEQADLLKGQYALFNDSTFQSSMKTAFTNAVNAAVTSGVITQAQADQILSKAGNMFMKGMGGFGGFGAPRGHGGGWMNDGGPAFNP